MTTENLSDLKVLFQDDTYDNESEFDVKDIGFTLSDEPSSHQIHRQIVDATFGDKAFLLHPLLSEVECNNLIAKCESHGFDEIQGPAKAYRSCLRIVYRSNTLADQLWQRLREHLHPIVIEDDPHEQGIHGCPTFMRGRWEPLKLNPLFRVCRYEPGQHFGPHYDGHFVENGNTRSLQTFMVYLNDVPEDCGGATNFIDSHQSLHRNQQGLFCAEFENVKHRVHPRTGLAIVFNHHQLHEGEMLRGDGLTKYILRTDIMFHRTNGQQLSKEQDEALRLLQEAERMEALNRGEEAVRLYKRAFRLCPDLENFC